MAHQSTENSPLVLSMTAFPVSDHMNFFSEKYWTSKVKSITSHFLSEMGFFISSNQLFFKNEIGMHGTVRNRPYGNSLIFVNWLLCIPNTLLFYFTEQVDEFDFDAHKNEGLKALTKMLSNMGF